MPTFGVVPTGFNRKTVDDILTAFQEAQRANISPAIDLSTESPIGQINAIVSQHMAELWELAEDVYHGFDPDAATDDQLTHLALLTGVQRRAATKSTVTCTCDLDAGTYAVGSLVAHVDGAPDSRFVNVAEVTSTGGATAVEFEAEDTGPVVALSGTLTVIAEPVTGWNSVTNDDDAAVGNDIESDAALRVRRETALATAGSERVAAIRASVLAVSGVVACDVLENRTDAEDANGLPAHSFEVIVYDGVGLDANDDEIAQAIWEEHPAGIEAYGTGESGTAVDASGNDQTVNFTRVEIVEIYVQANMEVTEATYAGDAAVRAAIVAYGDENYAVGSDVVISKLYAPIDALTGIEDIVNLKVGLTEPTLGTANIPIGVRQIAHVDSSAVIIFTA